MPPPPLASDSSHRYTVEEVLAFPSDGNRYEVIDGELFVTPAPRIDHQRVTGLMYALLWHHMKRFDLAHTVFFSPADITYGPTTLVQPDIFVIHPGETGTEWSTIKRLRLVIEVISPSTARYDRMQKRKVYLQNGVETYWIVDPSQWQVEVWTPSATTPKIETETVAWRHTPEGDPLVIDILELWREARVR